MKAKKGFTLIELLVVIGILAVLLTIVLIAINPQRQLQAANDTQRRSDVQAILNAIYQFSVDNQGTLPSGVSGTGIAIGSAAGGTGAAFCTDLVPTYIAALPRDPTSGSYTDCTTYATGYTLTVTGTRVTVSATGQLVTPIEVTR